jgi:flagellar hook-associated protein 2
VAGTFQIGGLVSGLDTAKIIETLMTVEQRPLKQLESQQQRLIDRKTALAELATKLSTLRSKSLSLMLSPTSQARAATSSNTAVATAVASPGTALQQVNLQVISLATKSTLSSGAAIGNSIDPTVTLANAGFGTTPTSGTFSINGVNITVNAATETLNDVINNINASGAGVTATLVGNQLELSSNGPITIGVHGNTSNFLQVTKLAASMSVFDGVATYTNTSTAGMGVAQATKPLASANLAAGLPDPTGQFTINGVAFTWDSSVDTINTIVSKINSSAAKVTASYDLGTDRVTLTAKETGPAAIAVSDDTGTLLNALGLMGGPQSFGQAAQYSVNGGPVQASTSNVVTDAVSGMTFTLKGVGNTSIDVTQDVAATVNGVKEWVAAYNEALSLIRTQLAVDPATNVPGIFTGNSTVQGIEARLRRVANTKDSSLGTIYTELPNIGISTGAIGATPGTTNELVLDESKLTQALTQDPAAVSALLSSTTGPVATLNTYLLGVTGFTGPLKSSQSSAERQIRDLDTRMRSLQTRLNARQVALEKKFAALEAAMARMQAQSAQLSGQLGQLGALGGGR